MHAPHPSMPAAPDAAPLTPRASDPGADAGYTQELRFGVVMYGGVSLAIYINGVANELFEMACATPRHGHVLDDTGATGTREVYRRLSWLAADSGLRAGYATALKQEAKAAVAGERAPVDVWQPPPAGSERMRLVVDVISGTSAGGINGVFLAKALAGGQRFDTLQRLWVVEGDLGKLINDGVSWQGLPLGLRLLRGEPKSLLNSDRMYLKLLEAMQAMAPLPRGKGDVNDGSSPLVDQVDLFVTTTDIDGAPVPLRLFDKVVLERRHRQVFHFRHPAPGDVRGDFVSGNVPFLAFAARCTSSFPFAFEPMTLAAVTRLGGVPADAALRQWDLFFPRLPQREVAGGHHLHRAFGDGGYLDNKPFTYAVETLARRSTVLPLERKLLYIEPVPEQLDAATLPSAARQPDAVSNAVAALTRIPLYETIREDLQAVLQRNRRIERVERIVQLSEVEVERALQRNADPFSEVARADGVIAPWAQLTLSHMVRYYGVGFLPYRRLRVYALCDTLADDLAARWGVDAGSDHRYALRVLVRLWRERGYDEEGLGGRETINAFLDQFDLPYRVRRLGMLLRRIDQVARLLRRYRRAASSPPDEHTSTPASELERYLVSALARALCRDHGDEVLHALEQSAGTALPPALNHALGKALGDVAWLDDALAGLRVLKQHLLTAHEGLRRVTQQQGQAPADDRSQDQTLRDELRAVLGHLLDEPVAAGTTPVLTLRDGSRWPMPPAAPPRGRTLQERVLERAQDLFQMVDAANPDEPLTVLQHALQTSLLDMRFKQRPRPGAGEDMTPGNVAAGLAWRSLGRPHLARGEGAQQRVTVALQAVASADLARLQLPGSAADAAEVQAALLNGSAGTTLRWMLAQYYLHFDSFDQTSFPLYYDTGTGEPATVEVVRVSPVDATRLVDEAGSADRGKLAGTSLANFGAFLDERFRRNDIMWGRLDGAERLIHALLPAADDDSREVREALIDQAHDAILRETLVRDGREQLGDLLVNALQDLPGAAQATGSRLRQLLNTLHLGDSVQRQRLETMLAALLDERGLRHYMAQVRQLDRRPEPQAMLRNASRAVAVAGRVLQGISQGPASAVPGLGRWLARAGLVMQGAVALSMPGTLQQGWASYAVKVLYGLQVLVLIAALLFGNQDLRSLALTTLLLTAALHLMLLLLGDMMRERRRVQRLLVASALGAALALALLGASGWARLGPVTLLCGPGAVTAAAQGRASLPCRAALVASGWKQALLQRLRR